MIDFKPCQGKTACRDDGERCLTCGRSLDEIAELRELLKSLTELAITYQYENVDSFSDYIGKKLRKSIEHRRQSCNEHY